MNIRKKFQLFRFCLLFVISDNICEKIFLGKGILFWISGTFRNNADSDDDNDDEEDDDTKNFLYVVKIMMIIMMKKYDFLGSCFVVRVFFYW